MMRTKLGRAGAVLALTAVLGASAARAQDERVLTVEQTAIQAVQAPPPAAASNPLDVVAWVDHATNTYAQGEQVRVFVQVNKDAYVTVLNVGPDGSTTVLFPNRYQTDNRVRANTVTEVPDPASRARIAVSGTTGAELIKVVATTRPAPLFAGAQLAQAGVFQTLRQRAQETARNLAVVMAEAETAEWDVYDKVIRTVPQRPAAAAPAPPPPVAGAGWPSAPFGLELAADRPVYRVTDPVTLMVKAEADCHLSLLNTAPGGASRLLFPNRYQQQTLIRAGQTVVVPGIGAAVSIVPLGPAGVEHVTALCRTGAGPVIGAPGDFRAGPFATFDDAGATARNLAVVADPAGERTAIASASFVVIQ
ncbi:MAG: DUF4384 domain-containing protein [Acidobacteria bacterium]|nr:DUF4384 domain-containing protein [Acidobacteriota bacterium]